MAGVRSNRDILTGGKRYAQKAAKKHRVEEVVFDKESRKEYLTGFHKRKLERQKKAQQYNKEQERLARIKERKEIRDERKLDMEKQLQKFNETVAKITNLNEDSSDDDEWSGFDEDKNLSDNQQQEGGEELDKEPEQLKQEELKGILSHKEVYKLTGEEEFDDNVVIDDETTVEVESIENPIVTKMRQTNLEILAKVNNVDLSKSEEILDESIKKAKNYAVVCGVAKPSYKDKVKKKKFRYLSKAERKVNTRNERFKSKSKRPAK